MTSREIGVAMMRLGAESLAAHMLADPRLVRRDGFAIVRRGGMLCYSSEQFRAEVFNHVSGYATFAPASKRALDAVIRRYEERGESTNIEVLVPSVSRADRALLERSGFRHSQVLFQCHVRTMSHPPRTHAVPGLRVARATKRDALRYAKLATRGFGGGGPIANVFEVGWTRQIAHATRIAAFIGSVNGVDAATGIMLTRPTIAGFYSGSVLPRFRGRGIQNAMIAARIAHGWARGLRTFYSWSDPDSSSAKNLRDEGFRTRFEVHMYTRKP